MRISCESEIDNLADSLSSTGQLSPIRVRPNPKKETEYQIIFGNRRLAAAKKLGWKTISAEVVQADEAQTLIMAFSENGERKDFSDYEKALLIERIHETTKKTYVEIAELIGKSPAYVSQHVAMLTLFTSSVASTEERTRVLNSLSEKHARILAKKQDMADRWNTAKLVLKANLSPRELEKMNARSNLSKNLNTKIANRKEIERVITNSVRGLPAKDMRPFFNLTSSSSFTMFSRFPPYDRLNLQMSSEHVNKTLHSLESVAAQIDELEIRMRGHFAYATYYVTHNISLHGERVKTRTRATVILEHEDQWRMVHAHYSAADPASLTEAFLRQSVTR